MASLAATESTAAAPPRKGAFKRLRPELAAAAEKFGSSQIRISKVPKGKPGAPWPVKIQRTVPQPKKAALYDVYELKVTLCIEGPGILVGEEGDAEGKVEPQISVAMKKSELPEILTEKICQQIRARWMNFIHDDQKLPEQSRKGGWYIVKVLTWVEKHFVDLLQLIPKLVDSYLCVDSVGASSRRYAILPKLPGDNSSDSDADAAEGLVDPEDLVTIIGEDGEEIVMSKDAAARLEKDIERRLEADRRRRIREARELEQQRLENEKKKEEAMRRRANGEELGRRQLSKKEKEALRKPKKGVRQAKTGPRRKKYDGEGSALEKAKSGKSKKKS
eukprot:g1901.t1